MKQLELPEKVSLYRFQFDREVPNGMITTGPHLYFSLIILRAVEITSLLLRFFSSTISRHMIARSKNNMKIGSYEDTSHHFNTFHQKGRKPRVPYLPNTKVGVLVTGEGGRQTDWPLFDLSESISVPRPLRQCGTRERPSLVT